MPTRKRCETPQDTIALPREPLRRRRLAAAVLLAASGLLPLPLAAARAEEDGHAHEHPHDEHAPLEEIVTTTSPLEHSPDELATPVDVLTRDTLLEGLGTTLGETLSGRPGVTTSSFAAGASRPVIRGQDAFRTEVLEGGLSTQDVSRLSPDHGIPINPLSAQRIEVVRGAATLRYGGGASAGVVNALTNRVPGAPDERAARGEAFGSFGNVADERDIAFVLEGGMGASQFGEGKLGGDWPVPIAWHVDAMSMDHDDYEIPGNGPKTQSGTFIDANSIAVGASVLPEWGRFGFAYARFENDYGIPEEDEDVEIDMNTNRYRFEGDWDVPSDWARELRVRGVYSNYTHDEIVDGDVGQTFDNDEFDGRLELLHAPAAEFVGAFGMHFRHRDFEAGGEAAEFLAPSETLTIAGYLFEERPLLDWLNSDFGLRVESTQVEGTPISGNQRDRSFVPVSGAASLLVEPIDGWLLGVTGSASQRAPSDSELFARGPHEATGTFEIGDPGFEEETSYSGELKLNGETGPVRIESAFFVTRYYDYIYGDLTGISVDEDGNPVAPADPDALDQLFYRARGARFYGGEVFVEAKLFECLSGAVGLDGQVDFVRAKFTSGGNVPRITPVRWGGGAWFRSDPVELRLGFLRNEKQDHTAQGESATAGFTLLDVAASVRFAVIGDRVPLTLSVRGHNLLDANARNHVSFNKDEVKLPGRGVRAAIHGRF